MFNINGKEYSHKEVNKIYEFFSEDQWDLIISSLMNMKDDDEESPYNEGIDPTIDSIQQLWRCAY